jgi:superfamily II DNA/RNA helicase
VFVIIVKTYNYGLQKRSEPLKPRQVGAIVISPTRELATQTFEVLAGFLKHLPQFTSVSYMHKGKNLIIICSTAVF